MSTNLYWKPVVKDYSDLPLDLKWALQKRYGGFVKAVMTEEDISYLKGLDDAGTKGAKALIKAIRDFGEVEVFEE